MIEKAFAVIDQIETTDIKQKLFEIKKEINSNDKIKMIIKRFKEAKELYEKYGDEKSFLSAKEELLKEDLLKKYVAIQNEINLLALHINSRIKMITEGIPKKR